MKGGAIGFVTGEIVAADTIEHAKMKGGAIGFVTGEIVAAAAILILRYATQATKNFSTTKTVGLYSGLLAGIGIIFSLIGASIASNEQVSHYLNNTKSDSDAQTAQNIHQHQSFSIEKRLDY